MSVSREFELERLIARLQEMGSIACADLSTNDEVHIETSRQVITMIVITPATGEVIVSGDGDWAIMTHVCQFWGSLLHPQSPATASFRWIPGSRLSIGPWITPPMTRIVINGCDMTTPCTGPVN